MCSILGLSVRKTVFETYKVANNEWNEIQLSLSHGLGPCLIQPCLYTSTRVQQDTIDIDRS